MDKSKVSCQPLGCFADSVPPLDEPLDDSPSRLKVPESEVSLAGGGMDNGLVLHLKPKLCQWKPVRKADPSNGGVVDSRMSWEFAS
jgi:hypothetical protein